MALPDYTQYSRPTFNFGGGYQQSMGGSSHPFFGAAGQQSYVQDSTGSGMQQQQPVYTTQPMPSTGGQPSQPGSNGPVAGIEPPDVLFGSGTSPAPDPGGGSGGGGGTQPGQPPTYSGPQEKCNPFFDPNCNYKTPGQPYAQTPLPGAGQPGQNPFNLWASDQDPEGYYYSQVASRGFGGLDARSKAAQGLYGQYARGYQAAKTKNMELMFPDYMNTQDIESQIRLMSDEQLGIDRERYSGNNRRYGLRS
jgi:hypothetical protein